MVCGIGEGKVSFYKGARRAAGMARSTIRMGLQGERGMVWHRRCPAPLSRTSVMVMMAIGHARASGGV